MIELYNYKTEDGKKMTLILKKSSFFIFWFWNGRTKSVLFKAGIFVLTHHNQTDQILYFGICSAIEFLASIIQFKNWYISSMLITQTCIILKFKKK